MYLEGARWDMTSNSLEDSKPKEMFTGMPVITCKAGVPAAPDRKKGLFCFDRARKSGLWGIFSHQPSGLGHLT